METRTMTHAALALGLLLLSAPLAAAHDEAHEEALALAGITRAERLVVIDSRGLVIGVPDGASVGYPAVLAVALRVGHQLIQLGVASEGFVATEPILAFTSTDCTGVPYLMTRAGYVGLLPPVVLSGPGNTLFVPAPGATVHNRHVASVRTPVDDRWPTGCNAFPLSPAFVIEAHEVVDLNTLFVPPFALDARPASLPRHTHRQTRGHQTGPGLLLDAATGKHW
jgi:hypothetical protein